MLIVSQHAIERYRERVENVPEQIVRERLSTRAFDIAAAFGSKYVLLHGGHRAVICDRHVITVLEKGMGIASHYGDIRGIER